MHTPSRRSPLTLLALGVMAAVVAVAGSADSSRSASAAASAGRTSGDIHEIDFASVAQPGVTCADAVDDHAPRAIAVSGGVSDVLDRLTLARLRVDPAVVYGDLDDDGDDEAIVRTSCTFGANGAEESVQVWASAGRLPILVDTVTGAPRRVADDSRFPPTVADVAVDGDDLAVTFEVWAQDDPHCCPTQQAVVRYALDGDLEVDGRPRVGPAA
ncbi:MAG TPA: LppP/LprE family lipoprotein [Acidimicrobiales bacterium]|nr:LppP/LprE family lipoprotein [Acidimicrobiales bacterium]